MRRESWRAVKKVNRIRQQMISYLSLIEKMSSNSPSRHPPPPPAVVRHRHRHNLRNRFELVRTLGQGTYGKVKLAIEKSSGNKVRPHSFLVFINYIYAYRPVFHTVLVRRAGNLCD